MDCPVCSKSFSTTFNLNRHLQNVHKNASSQGSNVDIDSLTNTSQWVSVIIQMLSDVQTLIKTYIDRFATLKEEDEQQV